MGAPSAKNDARGSQTHFPADPPPTDLGGLPLLPQHAAHADWFLELSIIADSLPICTALPTISLPSCASSGPTQNVPQHSPSCLHGHTVRVSAESWKASLDAVHAQYIPEQFFPPGAWRCLESFQVAVMGNEDLFTGSF